MAGDIGDANVHSIRVEIVEDEEAIRTQIRYLLSGSGCTIEEASSAQEARSLLRDFKPDIVILDLAIPALPGRSDAGVGPSEISNGAKVAVELRSLHPRVRVLLITKAEVSLLRDSSLWNAPPWLVLPVWNVHSPKTEQGVNPTDFLEKFRQLTRELEGERSTNGATKEAPVAAMVQLLQSNPLADWEFQRPVTYDHTENLVSLEDLRSGRTDVMGPTELEVLPRYLLLRLLSERVRMRPKNHQIEFPLVGRMRNEDAARLILRDDPVVGNLVAAETRLVKALMLWSAQISTSSQLDSSAQLLPGHLLGRQANRGTGS